MLPLCTKVTLLRFIVDGAQNRRAHQPVLGAFAREIRSHADAGAGIRKRLPHPREGLNSARNFVCRAVELDAAVTVLGVCGKITMSIFEHVHRRGDPRTSAPRAHIDRADPPEATLSDCRIRDRSAARPRCPRGFGETRRRSDQQATVDRVDASPARLPFRSARARAEPSQPLHQRLRTLARDTSGPVPSAFDEGSTDWLYDESAVVDRTCPADVMGVLWNNDAPIEMIACAS